MIIGSLIASALMAISVGATVPTGNEVAFEPLDYQQIVSEYDYNYETTYYDSVDYSSDIYIAPAVVGRKFVVANNQTGESEVCYHFVTADNQLWIIDECYLLDICPHSLAVGEQVQIVMNGNGTDDIEDDYFEDIFICGPCDDF